MTPELSSRKLKRIFQFSSVIPVLTVSELAHARPLAKALIAGGLSVLEVTLRTESATMAISAMARISGCVVGAGTVLSSDDVKRARAAGAQFAVSPGATETILDACEREGLPLLPGSATASEAMYLAERGYTLQKFFPAGPSGGPGFLKAMASPLPNIQFCPTGGVSQANASEYLSLPNVCCVGGSWMVPQDCLIVGDWCKIEELAKMARCEKK